MAAEFTIEQFKAFINEIFPDNTSRKISELDIRDGLSKLADFVFNTNSSEYIQKSIESARDLRNEAAALTETVENFTEQNALILQTTTSQKEAVDNAAARAELAANNADLGLLPKGSWNPVTNTPSLTATPEPSWSNGAYLDVSPVSGSIPFAGENFLAGQAVSPGDRLKKVGTQWSWIKASDLALQKILDLLSSISENFEFQNGFQVTDANGNIGMEITPAGILRAASILASSLTASKVNGVEFYENEEYAQLVTDSLGYISYYLSWDGKIKNVEVDTKALKIGSQIAIESDGDGGVAIKNIVTNTTLFSVTKNGGVTLADLKVLSDSSEMFPFSYTDEAGNIGKAYDRKGNEIASSIKSKSSVPGFYSDINHIIFYGQSLSLGGLSQPTLTVGNRFNSLMFNGGLQTNNATDPTVNRASLVSLAEGTQETPCSGFSEAMCELLIADGYTLNEDFRFLFSCPGASNTTIANLGKGSVPYSKLLLDVQYGLLRANELGKTYNVPAICWNQGEADALNNSTYQAALIQLQKDLSFDIKLITNQPNEVKLVIYQTASCNAYFEANVGKPIVGMEQITVALRDDVKNIYMSGPMYQWDYVADNVHLQPLSSKLNGATHAVAVHALQLKNPEDKPIRVIGISVQGSIVELKFAARKLPLVLDTVNVTNPGNYGFRLFGPTGTEITIISVALVRGDTIKINASAAIPPGAYVNYAANGTYPNSGRIAGTRGNLRDSQDILFDPAGLAKHIYNWSPIFKQIIK